MNPIQAEELWEHLNTKAFEDAATELHRNYPFWVEHCRITGHILADVWTDHVVCNGMPDEYCGVTFYRYVQ